MCVVFNKTNPEPDLCTVYVSKQESRYEITIVFQKERKFMGSGRRLQLERFIIYVREVFSQDVILYYILYSVIIYSLYIIIYITLQVCDIYVEQWFSTCNPLPTSGPQPSAWWSASKA